MTDSRSPDALPPDVGCLVDTFFLPPGGLGQFEPVAVQSLPAKCQTLLAHDDHMTVTHEAFYGTLVDVRVLGEHHDGDIYARQSLLARQSDGVIVQYGIVQVDLAQIDSATRREIVEKQTPLGRVLIRHNVLRHVELVALYRIMPSCSLAQFLDVQTGSLVFGRAARIHVNGIPAVELLEIVRPPES